MPFLTPNTEMKKPLAKYVGDIFFLFSYPLTLRYLSINRISFCRKEKDSDGERWLAVRVVTPLSFCTHTQIL